MMRININIKDNIDKEEALWCCLRASQKLKETGHGVVTFHNDVVVSMRETQKGNDTFTVYKRGDND